MARLYSIAVDRRFRGRGQGARLLADAEAVAADAGRSSLRLEVREGNRRARALYAGRGYAPIGRRDGYYEDGAAALRYEKPLTRRLHVRSSRRGD